MMQQKQEWMTCRKRLYKLASFRAYAEIRHSVAAICPCLLLRVVQCALSLRAKKTISPLWLRNGQCPKSQQFLDELDV
jgi:hypothetical protein